MLVDISRILSDANIDITALSSRVDKKGNATIIVSFNIHNREELADITGKIRKVRGVMDIVRAQG